MLGNIIGKFKHNPFNQKQSVLISDKKRLNTIITSITGNEDMLFLFNEAFNFFMIFPERYDGATGDSENGAFKKYDIPSIIHDYMDVRGACYTFELMRASDKMFKEFMEQLSFYSIQIKKREISLWLIAHPRWWRMKLKFNNGEYYRNDNYTKYLNKYTNK